MSESVKTGDAIVDGMAATFWALAWADAEEEAGRASSLVAVDILDVMPPVPLEAVVDAARIIGRIEQANGLGINSLLSKAAREDALGDEEAAEEMFDNQEYRTRFGQCIAYMALGHGVSWFDDHVEFELDIPYCDASATEFAATIKTGNDREDASPDAPTA